MTRKGRLTLDLPPEMVDSMREIAERRATTVTNLTRVAYNLLIMADEGLADGHHLVLTRQPRRPDTRVIALL